ncbi:MAG: methionyl-tRNA formyltransferase [Candidatus Omnitrophica bacterium]|nr:methionyl-tRNA formyltransferase [Candidatus Omnitrophota bacterium]
MKIVFFGSSHFAIPSLDALIKSPYEICSVVTQPDKKKGRHLHLSQTNVKALAKREGLKVFQPGSINTGGSLKYLKDLAADIFVIVAYGQILAQEALDLAKIFPINIHASLLPKYRGAAPINWAVINGEKSAGISIIQVTRKMDSGPIFMQREIPIGLCDDAIILEDKLRRLGAELLMDTLKEIENETFKLTPQNEKQVIMAPKLKKDDGYIDWGRTADEIYNKVRGCLPWPGAFTYYKGKLLKIYKVGIGPQACQAQNPQIPEGADKRPGTILKADKEGLEIMAGDSSLIIKELQLEGGRQMPAKDFISGHRIQPGERFK